MLSLSRKGFSDGAVSNTLSEENSATRGISPSHTNAVAEFRADLDMASKDVVEEMMTYEEKFFKEIEKEAGNIMQSFLNR
ncbi:uncharacterized protein GGS25DRAFT_524060 [Hypoxylon fragiforme]|uniref:uncharacterized protein n=1 Tax=Hypoxylon fragiforme TaxID=63214 RepID=UPI0020C5DE19|nr:uncharacterized protein GGS25DRAFT_524060 [Hypoxylon fragiforme]KAI2606393.1 hypothetical protein GGS25DRAFT_524060 [Hypoxylon fragiforme]